MESIFSKTPSARAVTVYDQIAPEILHLQKGSSVREAEARSQRGAWAASVALLLVIGLFFMDPFLYAMHKSSATKAYIYLHNFGSDSSTKELVASQIFTSTEIEAMNNSQGNFQSYFSSPADAGETAASAVNFMQELRALREGEYENLDPIQKLRYTLFVRNGLFPPTVWSALNPSVTESMSP